MTSNLIPQHGEGGVSRKTLRFRWWWLVPMTLAVPFSCVCILAAMDFAFQILDYAIHTGGYNILEIPMPEGSVWWSEETGELHFPADYESPELTVPVWRLRGYCGGDCGLRESIVEHFDTWFTSNGWHRSSFDLDLTCIPGLFGDHVQPPEFDGRGESFRVYELSPEGGDVACLAVWRSERTGGTWMEVITFSYSRMAAIFSSRD